MAFQFVAVGASLGGLHALKTVFSALPGDFPLPIAVVQHRSVDGTGDLTPLLSRVMSLPVLEVDDKQPIEEGRVYVCPANYHLLVDDGRFALSTDAPVLHARPSIDVLFESAAEFFGSGVIGVLLTGMSRDGSAGLRKIKAAGGCVVVQDPSAAEAQVMPRTAIESVDVDRILPLQEIAPFLRALCSSQGALL
jgi:two-component system chemotaxis response regulator CheB